jgi:hypothetical protein
MMPAATPSAAPPTGWDTDAAGVSKDAVQTLVC